MIIRRIEPKKARETKRVAPYVRVSTNQNNQEESFETQYAAYQNLIEATPDWVLAEVYADKGKSGTSTKHRPGFQKMIADAEAGKIDIILVKSISRFARNVGDCQKYVDILRACNVTVIFEKENIRSDEPTSNFALALIGATAQDESHSISENRRWAYKQQFADGKFNLGNNRILGYDTVGGKLVPNEDAWIVREIFEQFVAGKSYAAIARSLAEKGAKTIRGGDFSIVALRYMISNETYVGDKHLQKQPPKDYLTHRPNRQAEYQDYYLKDDHEGIVSRELWDQAQEIRKGHQERRKSGLVGAGEHHILYGKLFCGECGAPFVRRTLLAKDGQYAKVWNCRERQKGKKGNGCRCRFVREEEVLEEIRKQAGWEQFDETKMKDEIERVTVWKDRIEIAYRDAE